MNLNPVIKNIFFIITCPLVIAACTKSTSVTGSTSITYSANQHQDTFTVVDNGVTFSANSTFANIGECVIEKSPSGSLFSIRTFQTTSFPFGISLHNIPGPLDGAGIFKQALADSPGLVSSTSTVVEVINDSVQINYFVDSAIINISYASVNTIIGSYTLWMNVAYDTTRKTLTGIIKLYTADIE